MKNTLTDLNNHLFETLERLNDEELQGEKLEAEINRANAISNVAAQIVKNGNLALRAAESFGPGRNTPEILRIDGDRK